MESQHRIGRTLLFTCLASILGFGLQAGICTVQGQVIDWPKVRQLYRGGLQRQTPADRAKEYLERVDQERHQKRLQRSRSQSRLDRRAASAAKGKETTGLIPLTELGESNYKGQTGGLYGKGGNMPPAAHLTAAKKELAKIEPLDADGKPSAGGKIVLISLGMSNTTQEFSKFKELTDVDADKSPNLVIVDCAQGGMAAQQWAHPESRMRKKRRPPWITMAERVQKAGVSPAQVQVVWIKQAQPMPARLGEFPKHAKSIQRDVTIILNKLKEKFANLRVAYLSSRIYAGYATTGLNPEPYAYESAFAVRWLIEEQIKGKPELNYDSARGEVKSPLLLWGPYLWADGVKPRKGDNLVWKREDFRRDGTHPSESGRKKVADMLLKFFKNHPTAKRWFLKRSAI
ncbi:MAG: hypothetical protein JSV03_12395 [Planctomycetota bacterium]|nr:MAG: hypothetical protein JSV03_12395 [Planctomycetota bacterium]